MAEEHSKDNRFGLATLASNNPNVSDIGELEPKQWSQSTVSSINWNKSFPFQFILCKKTKEGWGPTIKQDPLNSKSTEAYLNPFTLPVPPESLAISTPFSVSTTATLNGIVEEHNGIVFRMITIRGTTGILPLRNSGQSSKPGINPTVIGGIFAGTIQSLNNTASIFPGVQKPNTVAQKDTEDGDIGLTTGFHQFLLLQKWLEAYSRLKQLTIGRDYALGFAIHKEGVIYICSPVSFDLQRSASSPLEYQYTIQLKAWRRIQSSSTNTSEIVAHAPLANSPFKMAKVLNTLTSARRVLEGAKNTLTAFRGDVAQTLINPMKESILFLKDGLGLGESAAELPANILQDLREPLLEFDSLKTMVEQTGARYDKIAVKIRKAFDSLTIESGKLEIQGARSFSSNPLGSDPTKTAHPANKADSLESLTLLESIDVSSLKLKGPIREKIKEEKKRVRNLKREDFEVARTGIEDLLNNFQASLGLLPETVAATYGIPTQTKTREPVDSDYEIIYALSQTLQQFDHLIASSTINRDTVDTLDFIAGLANRSGIAFNVPRGKFLVPFPYGATLEQLAQTYLGNPERWHEIAALNGLQSPYVDEVGFTLPLLVNGLKNTVVVADASKLYVNQTVWISSSITARSKRRITMITKLTEGQYLLTLTGEPDLNQYSTAAGAFLQAFLPNTINSQQSFYIPSSEEVDAEDFRQKAVPGVDAFDPLVRVGGIDLLLDSSNDLVITPDGNCRLAAGLTNIIQKIRVLLATPLGSLMSHPEYGFPIQPGQSQAELTADQIAKICSNLFKDDPSFEGVKSVSVLKDGPAVVVTLFLIIRGVSQIIPVTVNIVR